LEGGGVERRYNKLTPPHRLRYRWHLEDRRAPRSCHSREGGNPLRKPLQIRHGRTGFPPSREWPLLRKRSEFKWHHYPASARFASRSMLW